MPQTNRINVTVYPKDSDDMIAFRDVNYLSFISFETYGNPAFLSEERTKVEGLPVRVLFVNPSNVAAVEAERTA